MRTIRVLVLVATAFLALICAACSGTSTTSSAPVVTSTPTAQSSTTSEAAPSVAPTSTRYAPDAAMINAWKAREEAIVGLMKNSGTSIQGDLFFNNKEGSVSVQLMPSSEVFSIFISNGKDNINAFFYGDGGAVTAVLYRNGGKDFATDQKEYGCDDPGDRCASSAAEAASRFQNTQSLFDNLARGVFGDKYKI